MSKNHICQRCNKSTLSTLIKDGEELCFSCFQQSKEKKPKARKHDSPEARIQTEFFRNMALLFPSLPDKVLFAVPNGGSRHLIEAKRLKEQGVKAGVADVLLLVPKKGYGCLCMEFKTDKGKQSEAQKEFARQMEMAGNKYIVVRSVKQAIEAVKEYLT